MENILLIGMPGGMEMFLIIFAILLLFGGKKIPELMRGIGKGIKEFNGARASIESEIKSGMKDAEKKELLELRDQKEKLELEEFRKFKREQESK